jgi:hypothetical protein
VLYFPFSEPTPGSGVGPPVTVKTLLQVLAKDLEWMGQEWAGFRLYNGELLGPNGEWITPGMIRAFPHMERALELQRLAMLDEHRAKAAPRRRHRSSLKSRLG